jgi:hypothetical protein
MDRKMAHMILDRLEPELMEIPHVFGEQDVHVKVTVTVKAKRPEITTDVHHEPEPEVYHLE